MHSSLFAEAMTALGLDPTYGAYLDRLPAVVLDDEPHLDVRSAPQAPRRPSRTPRKF